MKKKTIADIMITQNPFLIVMSDTCYLYFSTLAILTHIHKYTRLLTSMCTLFNLRSSSTIISLWIFLSSPLPLPPSLHLPLHLPLPAVLTPPVRAPKSVHPTQRQHSAPPWTLVSTKHYVLCTCMHTPSCMVIYVHISCLFTVVRFLFTFLLSIFTFSILILYYYNNVRTVLSWKGKSGLSIEYLLGCSEASTPPER